MVVIEVVVVVIIANITILYTTISRYFKAHVAQLINLLSIIVVCLFSQLYAMVLFWLEHFNDTLNAVSWPKMDSGFPVSIWFGLFSIAHHYMDVKQPIVYHVSFYPDFYCYYCYGSIKVTLGYRLDNISNTNEQIR